MREDGLVARPQRRFVATTQSRHDSPIAPNLLEHRITPSMSRKGNCWDNAVAESFFSSMLYELELGATWHTDADVARDVGAYIELFYNPRRRHSHNRYLSPVDFEREVVHHRST
jgi:transposase InsO family protein